MAHPNAALSMNQNFAGADVRTVPGGKDIAVRDSGFVTLLENGIPRRVYWAQGAAHRVESGDEHSRNADHRVGESTSRPDCGGGGLAVFLLVAVVWVVARRLTRAGPHV